MEGIRVVVHDVLLLQPSTAPSSVLFVVLLSKRLARLVNEQNNQFALRSLPTVGDFITSCFTRAINHPIKSIQK